MYAGTGPTSKSTKVERQTTPVWSGISCKQRRYGIRAAILEVSGLSREIPLDLAYLGKEFLQDLGDCLAVFAFFV
ncbi:MAG: hypothetical protein ACI8T1_003131 [Verrucomicrobiales bacterium]|jgi:hypothetical protein